MEREEQQILSRVHGQLETFSQEASRYITKQKEAL